MSFGHFAGNFLNAFNQQLGNAMDIADANKRRAEDMAYRQSRDAATDEHRSWQRGHAENTLKQQLDISSAKAKAAAEKERKAELNNLAKGLSPEFRGKIDQILGKPMMSATREEVAVAIRQLGQEQREQKNKDIQTNAKTIVGHKAAVQDKFLRGRQEGQRLADLQRMQGQGVEDEGMMQSRPAMSDADQAEMQRLESQGVQPMSSRPRASEAGGSPQSKALLRQQEGAIRVFRSAVARSPVGLRLVPREVQEAAFDAAMELVGDNPDAAFELLGVSPQDFLAARGSQ